MTTTFTIGAPIPTKKDIIQRLFQAGHIDFNEMWVLLQDEPEVKYVPMPQQQDPYIPMPSYPMPPWTPPYPDVSYSDPCKDLACGKL